MLRKIRYDFSPVTRRETDHETFYEKRRREDEEKRQKQRKKNQQEEEDILELGPDFVPLVNGDQLQHEILAKNTKSAQFKGSFLQHLTDKNSRKNLLTLLNFLDDPDWEVRFEVAKALRQYLYTPNKTVMHEVMAALNHLENDPDSAVRLHVIETFRSYRNRK